MTLQQNTDRILTTQVGSLPRPHDLLDMMKARLEGRAFDEAAYQARVRGAVAECVRKQADTGIDIVCDGEQSKPGFFTYVRERLDGFEARPQQRRTTFAAEVAAFPEYYEQYFRTAMLGGSVAPAVPLVCTGPIRYRGDAALQRDIENLKAALADVPHHAAFMPAVAPSGVGENEHYNTDEAFFLAVGEALHAEYRAIVDAGLILQIDDPFLSDLYGAASCAGGDLCRRDQCEPARHTGGTRALSHMLRHQPRPAHPRGGAGRCRWTHAAGECRRLQFRGGECAARA
jgi:5-methyltetrahydropteroyltriglutamate--homocysteine methyltransferase